MRVLPAILGGLAVLTAAFPVVDVAVKPETTTLAVRGQEVALPLQFLPASTLNAVVSSDDAEEPESGLVKRKSKSGSGGSSNNKPPTTPKKVTTKAADPIKTTAAPKISTTPKVSTTPIVSTTPKVSTTSKISTTSAATSSQTTSAPSTSKSSTAHSSQTTSLSDTTKTGQPTATSATGKVSTTSATGSGTGTNTGSQTGAPTGSQTGQTGTNTGTQTGSQTAIETGTNTGIQTGTQTGSRTGTETGTLTGTQTGTQTGTITGTQTGTTGTATTGTSTGTTTSGCAAETGVGKGLCGPAPLCRLNSKSTTATPKKTTKTARAIELVQALKRSIEKTPDHVSRFFKRANALGLSVADIALARTTGRTQPTAVTTGEYRFLHHGTAALQAGTDPDDGNVMNLPMAPNDNSYDAFGNGAFYRNFDGLRGCTGVMVASEKGLYSAHLWQRTMAADMAGVIRNLKTGDKDAKGDGNFAWKAKAQKGLTNYKSSWSDASTIQVAVFSPTTEGTTAASIVAAINAAIPGIPAGNIHIKTYTNSMSMVSDGTSGTMTAYYDGEGNVGIYGETDLITSLTFEPQQGGGFCTGGSCVVQR